MKKIAMRLRAEPKVTRTYYESGNIKTKSIAYSEIVLNNKKGATNAKSELEIVKEYYDDENAKKSKLQLKVLGKTIMEVIFSDDGKEKCSLGYRDFKDNVYKNFYKIDRTAIDIEFIDFSSDKQVYVTASILTMLLLPIPLEKEIRCSYDNVYISLTVNVKGIFLGEKSLKYAYVKIDDKKRSISNLDEAYNLLNKYYVPDESLKNKLKGYMKSIKDLFN